jgi:hypothetical protein
MKYFHRLALGLALLGALAITANAQQKPGAHPHYEHALSDLRSARWMLSNTAGDSKVSANEKRAIGEIDGAINEIKTASIDDGKSLNDHPPVDVKEHGSRLLKATEALHSARKDVDMAEDNPQLQGLKQRVNGHIDHAIEAADAAHAEWLKEKK